MSVFQLILFENFVLFRKKMGRINLHMRLPYAFRHVAFTQRGLLPEQNFIGIAVAKPLSVEQRSNNNGIRIAKERLVLVHISLEI
jgi:hypothetical protein